MTVMLVAPAATSRRGKPSPATQMREMLVRSRRSGVGFERAWESAFERIRWPHDTTHRNDWKDQLEADREQWRVAYEREGAVNKPLLALYSLLCQYGTERIGRVAA